MRKQTLTFVIIVLAALAFSALVVLFYSLNTEGEDEKHINNISPTPTVSPAKGDLVRPNGLVAAYKPYIVFPQNNHVYNSGSLMLNVSFKAMAYANMNYSATYSLDGQAKEYFPVVKHYLGNWVIYHGENDYVDGSVKLPALSAGSHSLILFLTLDWEIGYQNGTTVYTYYDNETVNFTVGQDRTPQLPVTEPKKAISEVIVKPWDGAIDPINGHIDPVSGYGIEVETVNSDGLLFRDDNVSLRINVASEYWVIQYAYFTSDLVVDKFEIPVSKSNYEIDLKKSFLINFINVPEGRHRVDFTAVLHDGTKAVAFIDFFVDT